MWTFVERIWIAAIFVLLTTAAHAASFDCSKASTAIEKMICADAELSRLDEELATSYSKALKEAPDKLSFKQQQRDWLHERGQCQDSTCIKRKYIRQINLLNTIFGCSKKNIIATLPKDVQKLVPLDLGIEAISELKFTDDVRIIAAIADPIWSFTYCGGDMPEYDTDVRVLFVWREKEAKWKQVGKNSQILYPITEAGISTVAIQANDSGFIVQNNSHNPGPNSSWYDNFTLEYDKTKDHVFLIKWESASYDYLLRYGGDYTWKPYEEAQKKYGRTINKYQGYQGEINYVLGTGSVELAEFAKPIEKPIAFKVSSNPIELEKFKGGDFRKIPQAPKRLQTIFDNN